MTKIICCKCNRNVRLSKGSPVNFKHNKLMKQGFYVCRWCKSDVVTEYLERMKQEDAIRQMAGSGFRDTG